MASADVQKHKSATEVKAEIRHDNKESRLKGKHSNIHIDKSMTNGNMSYLLHKGGRETTYAEDCKRYDELIEKLDKHPKANKRKDRVTEVCFEVPCPEDMKPEDEEAFFVRVGDVLCEQYGSDNLIQGYFHQDEKHEYFDPQENRMRMSLNHMTFRFVPGVDGRLNAKEFTKRSELVKMNKNLEALCQTEFGCKFNNGKGKRGKSVEQLKAETALAETERIIKDAQIDAYIDARMNAELSLIDAQLEADEILSDAQIDAQVSSESILSNVKTKAKQILAEAVKTRSEASESLREAIGAKRIYEQAKEATQNYLDSMKDERSLEDWAQGKTLKSGKTIYDLYLSDTEVENKRKNHAFNVVEQHRARVKSLESKYGDMLNQHDESNDMERG